MKNETRTETPVLAINEKGERADRGGLTILWMEEEGDGHIECDNCQTRLERFNAEEAEKGNGNLFYCPECGEMFSLCGKIPY